MSPACPLPPNPRPVRVRCPVWAAVAVALLLPGLPPAWAAGPQDGGATAPPVAPMASPKTVRPPAGKASAPRNAAKAAPDPRSADEIEAARIPTLPGPAVTVGDPLEHLRQRLAERLMAAPAAAAGGAYDLRVSPKPPAAHSRARGAVASAKAAAHGKAADKGAAGHAPHWAYEGGAGPEAWGGLRPEFALCKTGQRQSPIDIRGGLAVDLDPVRFDYRDSPFTVLDNGHTVQVEPAAGNAIEIGGKRFELQQFHFHRPSEETIDGRRFEMSLHLVHKDAQGRLAVVALLFDPGPAHPVLQQVWNNLPLERNEAAPARVPLTLAALLPDDRRYYTYMGSLTTPPCSEGVQWIVMRQPVTLAPEQIEIFARLYPMNARPLQSAAGRRIMQSN